MLDPAHTIDVHGRLRERELAAPQLFTSITGDKEFQGIKSISGLPLDFIRAFVAGRSGKNVVVIRLVDSKDPDGSFKLCSLETQLSWTFTLPSECISKEICIRWFTMLGDRHQNRLKTFVADGGFLDDGELDWKQGCFRPLWSADDILRGVNHINGVTMEVKNSGVSRLGCTVGKNWLDSQATFKQQMFPGVCMHTWWRSETSGPHEHAFVLKKCKAIEDEVTAIANKVKTERDATTATSSANAQHEEEARVHIKEDAALAARARGGKAREAAAKAAAKKKSKSEATL